MSSHNKVAVVTGAGTGIGKNAALALLKDGYRVGLVGRRKELLEQTAADAGGSNTLVLPADVGNPDAVKALFAKVKQAWAASICCSTTPAEAHRRFPWKTFLTSSGKRSSMSISPACSCVRRKRSRS